MFVQSDRLTVHVMAMVLIKIIIVKTKNRLNTLSPKAVGNQSHLATQSAIFSITINIPFPLRDI